MEVTTIKCPNCNSDLKFNAENQNWSCEFCGSAFSQTEIASITQKSEQYSQSNPTQADIDQPELTVYKCKSCGAEMVTDENTAATFCVYCGNVGIMKNRLEGKFKPDYIIPFKKTKKEAIQAYNDYRKGKVLAPNEFGKPENIDKITGVYIPFWLYDGNAFGRVSGERHDITTWRQGNYTYTKTDIYHIDRAGSIQFEKVPADGSKKFDDDTMDSIEPFDFKEMIPFNYSFLSGFLAEKYDVGPDEDKERASLRMKNSIIQSLDSTIVGTLINRQENKENNFTDIKYAMFPVWMLNTIIEGKPYTFAMNGQTGRMVGNIPIDKGKAFRFFLFRALIAMGIFSAIAWFFFM
ncbi:MAG: hypothetical protein MJ211_08160 [Bacteroidales bacterium]|nr:hypothetical protein [Bacteroidales bacterium]